MGTLDIERLVFVDEAAVSTALHPSYGWAISGVKPIITSPVHGARRTLIGAISTHGLVDEVVVDGSLDGTAFVGWIEEGLGPRLPKDAIVVMDQLRVHQVAGVEEALARFGAKVLYLPRYSPELNPIEMCWSWLKHFLRRLGPRSMPILLSAVVAGWRLVSAEMCRAWAGHCGYAVAST